MLLTFLNILKMAVCTAVISAVSAPLLTAQNGSKYATIDGPNSSSTTATGINSAGLVVGYYYSSNAPHGFLRHIGGAVVPFKPNGTLTTAAVDINDGGMIAGNEFQPRSGSFITGLGTVTQFDYGHFGTTVLRINGSGTVVGSYSDGPFALIRDPLGNFTLPTFTNCDYSYATSINDAGQVAGYYDDDINSQVYSYLLNPDGTIIIFSAPDAIELGGTFARAINQPGQITGSVQLSYGPYYSRGFVRDASGIITEFDGPGGMSGNGGTFPQDINTAGEIVGYVVTPTTTLGFTRDAAGVLNEFQFPGAVATYPLRVNASGLVAGYYIDASSIRHGFIAEP